MGGVLEHPMREIEIECLPKDVPDGVDLDVSELGINERLRVEDIQLENIVILSDPKSLVAQVVPPKVEVVEEEEVVAEEEELEEPEVITAKEEEAEEE
jgi:large subunit ribosomal protein L25